MQLDPNYVFTAAIFVFGLCFGSFLNVCIYRLPLGLSVVRPRSACPKCGKAIAGYDNIPVLSWLLLGGRCRGCKSPISPRYMVVELLTGLLWVACFLHFGPSLQTLKFCAFTFLILGLTFTDFDHKLLPDAMTLPGIWLGFAFSLLVPTGGIFSYYFTDSAWVASSPEFGWRFLSLGDALIGAAIGAGFVYGVGELYMRVRGVEGMGFGDVKLMAMIGAFLGGKLTVLVLFGASLAGGLFGLFIIAVVFAKRARRFGGGKLSRAWHSASLAMRSYEMPFGVFLGAMALCAVFFGSEFLRWYLGAS